MSLSFHPGSNITIDVLVLDEVELADARTRNITVRNSRITGQTTFRTGQLADANVLFDANVHRDWDKCSSCAEGRVWLPESTGRPSGVTIQNSEFSGGLSDGVQSGSNGTRIIRNEFHRLERARPGVCTPTRSSCLRVHPALRPDQPGVEGRGRRRPGDRHPGQHPHRNLVLQRAFELRRRSQSGSGSELRRPAHELPGFPARAGIARQRGGYGRAGSRSALRSAVSVAGTQCAPSTQ
jgi:hypothetical protein